MWWTFIVLFAAIWVFQFFLSNFQIKNYRSTLQLMSRRDSGYLGVGVTKKKIGKGCVLILVSDDEGIIEEAQVMQGRTVFSKFRKFCNYNGYTLEQVLVESKNTQYEFSAEQAVAKIREQMDQKQNDNLGVS